MIDFGAFDTTRGAIMRHLREQGIGTQVHYTPVHLQPYYRAKNLDLSLPGAAQYYARCLSLPLFPAMGPEHVDRVVETLERVLLAA